MTESLTAHDEVFITIIRRITTEQADFVYESPAGVLPGTCVYREVVINEDGGESNMGDPSCLIAQVLNEMGLLPVSTTWHEGDAAMTLMADVGDFTEPVLIAANHAQHEQDDHEPWSEAGAAFDRVLADHLG